MARAISSIRFVVLVALLVGCGTIAPVNLLTSDQNCHPAPAVGLLVVDQQYGTAISEQIPPPPDGWTRPVPIAWPAGFSGRYAGGEIEVVGPDGVVLAVTGKRYEFAGVGVEVGGIRAFGACAFALPR